jgi:hypothetical protein
MLNFTDNTNYSAYRLGVEEITVKVLLGSYENTYKVYFDWNDKTHFVDYTDQADRFKRIIKKI